MNYALQDINNRRNRLDLLINARFSKSIPKGLDEDNRKNFKLINLK